MPLIKMLYGFRGFLHLLCVGSTKIVMLIIHYTSILGDYQNHLVNKSFRETCPALTDCDRNCLDLINLSGPFHI
jgi:hypothetical protein